MMDKSIKILLLKNFKPVGREGQVIDVSLGYARNYLFPKKLAVPADDQLQANISEQQKKAQLQTDLKNKQVLLLKKELQGKYFSIEVEANPQGSLYAALKDEQILAKLKQGVKGLPENIKILNSVPIKSTGSHKIIIWLTPDIQTELNLQVIAQKQ